MSSRANDNLIIQQHPKEHMYLYFTMAVLWAAATLCSPRVHYVHNPLYGVLKMLLKNFKVPQNQQSNPSYQSIISNVCRNLYCIRSQAFVSMIKVHSIVLYNHGVNFIADIHTCTCVINLIKYTNWIVLLSMCNLLYG